MDEYGFHRDAWKPENVTAIRYGCIRITDGLHDTTDPDFITNPGLYILADAAHISVGLTQVRIEKTTGFIRVTTDGATNGVPLITGDETAAGLGLLFGGSGGQPHVSIKCARLVGGVPVLQNLADQAVYDSVATTYLNLWMAFLSPLVRG